MGDLLGDQSRSPISLLSILDTKDKRVTYGRICDCSSVYDSDDFSGFDTYFPMYDRTAWRLGGGWTSVFAIHPNVRLGAHWFRLAWFRAGENSHALWLISFVTTASEKSGLGKKKRQEGGAANRRVLYMSSAPEAGSGKR